MAKDPKDADGEVYDGPDRRMGDRRKGDRRSGGGKSPDRERRKSSDRRKSPGRRKSDFEISEHRKVERRINEYPMSEEELEFIKAVNDYKQCYNKPFPTWSEILHILKGLGYEKKAP
jgi:hypothetical protein